MTTTLAQSDLPGLALIHRGKVRDVYALDDQRLLMVASDRLSAFDVILPDTIPGKGEVLTQIAHFWFEQMADVLPNHLTGEQVADVLPDGVDAALYEKRSMVTKRLKPIPVEAVARGYLAGSGYKSYQQTGEVCGINLPSGLQMAEQLPQPIFTPATKAEVGDHDENISFEKACDLVGTDLMERIRDFTLNIYQRAAEYMAPRGIILADTKFEFGLDEDDNLVLMDEILTPDSSRYWPVDSYAVGSSPPSYDKQFVRDYLETLDWDKTPPGPKLPQDIIDKTAALYQEAWTKITQS